MELLSGECNRNPLRISEHWFRQWLDALQQRAITWANDDWDLCHYMASLGHNLFTHWGRVTHKCVGNLTIIGPDNGLLPGQRQAIIWTKAGILLIGPLGTNVSEILIAILTFSFKKMHLKASSAKWRPFFLSLNVLKSAVGNCQCLVMLSSCVQGEWSPISIWPWRPDSRN